MHSRFPVLSAMAVLLASGFQLQGQSLQTGSLIGTVRSRAGQPIAGARIRAKSGQTERVAITNAKGEFRMPLLNVGGWNLTVTHDQFQTAGAFLRVAINDTQTATFSLSPVNTVVVEVVDAVGSLDTTQAQVATSLSAEVMAQIPQDLTSLNALDGLMATIPGVQIARSGSFNIMGGTENENVLTLDGNITNTTYSNATNATNQPPREFLESVEVVTSGFGAEYGTFGGVVNALSKSGKNSWEGSAFYNMNFPHSQAAGFYNRNSNPPQNKPADPEQFYRWGATLGGPLIKDKLFIFLGYQGFKNVSTPTTLQASGANWDGLRPDAAKNNGPTQVSGKINWFINNENQLILSGSHSSQDLNQGSQYFDYGTLNRGTKSRSSSQSVNLTWNWVPRPNFYMTTSVGRFQNPEHSGPITGSDPTVEVADYNYFIQGPGSTSGRVPANPAFILYVTGNGGASNSYSNNPNTQVKIDLSWTLGDHQIRAGLLRQDTFYENSSTAFDLYLITNAIIQGTIFGDPGELDRIHQGANYAKYRGVLRGYYLKDVVELLPGLRLDAGLRYDPFSYKGQFGPYDGKTLARFEHFREQLQPRVGLVWDVDRDGRKKIFAQFGRYFMQMPLSAISWAQTSSRSYDAWLTGAWTYNPTYTRYQDAFTLLTANPTLSIEQSIQGKPNPVATDLRLPHKNAWTLGGDWTLGQGWTVGAVWNYWELKDVMEDSWFLNPDGSQAVPSVSSTVIWNPRPGPVTFMDANGDVRTWNSDFPEPKDRYINLNIHAKYNAERFYMALDYTWVHHYGNYQGEGNNWLNYSSSYNNFGYGSGGRTKDYDYARAIASGNYEANPVHEFKGRGGYRFEAWGHSFNVGPSVTWRSGFGMSKTMSAGGMFRVNPDDHVFAGNGSDVVIVDNQKGNSGTSPSVLLVDLDASATIKVGRLAIKPNMAILNLFNSRPTVGYYTNALNGSNQAQLTPDPNYGLVYTRQPGRSITAGVTVQF